MSRAPQKSTRVPAAVGLGVAGLAAVLALAGCSAGQNTQTDSVEPAVNGAIAQAGPIAIRDAMIAFPAGGGYPSGGQAPLVLTIVNTGSAADELVEVSSSVAGSVEVSGDTNLPARRAIQVGTPGKEASPRPTSSSVTTTRTPTTSVSVTGTSAPPSSEPSGASSAPSSATSSAAPVEIGKATIVLTGLANPLSPGKTYSVTFVFRNAGSVTLDLPIAAPTSARPEPTGTESG